MIRYARTVNTMRKEALSYSAMDARETVYKGVEVPKLLVFTFCLYLIEVVTRAHELVPRGDSLRLVLLTLIVLALLCVYYYRYVPVSDVIRSSTGLAFLSLTLLGVVSVFTSIWQSNSVAAIRSWIPYAALFIIAAALFRSTYAKRWALKSLFFASTAIALLSVLRGEGRFGFGYTLDPNDTAALFVMAIPLASYLIRGARWPTSIMIIAGTIILIAGVFRTGSRGGLLALIAVVIASVFVFRGRYRTLGIVALLLGIAITPIVFTDELKQRIEDIRSGEDYNFTSDGGRLAIWKRGLRYMNEKPLLGVGIGNFTIADQEDAEDDSRSRGSIMTAHNSFIQVGAELGYIGMALFIFIILSSMRSARKVIRAYDSDRATGGVCEPVALASSVLLMLVGMTIAGMFLSLAYSALFVITFAIANASASVLVRKSSIRHNPRRRRLQKRLRVELNERAS